jgi:hypothetical protein
VFVASVPSSEALHVDSGGVESTAASVVAFLRKYESTSNSLGNVMHDAAVYCTTYVLDSLLVLASSPVTTLVTRTGT